MAKNHRDFVILVRNGVEINALVAISHNVYFHATQDAPAYNVEHLTLVFLDPSGDSQRPTGDQLRNSIKTLFDVPLLTEGQSFGWKDVVTVESAQLQIDGSGSEKYGASDWTAVPGEGLGYPGSGAYDATPSSPVAVEGKSMHEEPNENQQGPDGKTDKERGAKWGSPEHMAMVTGKPVPASFQEDFVGTDPEAQKAFNDANSGKDKEGDESSSYEQTLRENAETAHGQVAKSADGLTPSGKGPNPAPLGTDPSLIDNPAPSSPKDASVGKGDAVGEASGAKPSVGIGQPSSEVHY